MWPTYARIESVYLSRPVSVCYSVTLQFGILTLKFVKGEWAFGVVPILKSGY